MMQIRVAGEDGVREMSLIDPDSGVDFEKGKGTMKYWMIHGGNGGEQLGCWQAESAAEALGMLAKAAGYASKEEADRVLQESGGHVYPEEIEEITKEEYDGINKLLASGIATQREALDEFRKESAAEAGDNWMLAALIECDENERDRSEWYEMTWPEFSQALTNDILPDFKTIEEVDAFYDAAWNRLQREGIIDAIDLQREGIIDAIEEYNEDRPDHMHLHFGECKGDFIDPDAGEWKPYGAWNYRGDLVFVCEDIAECRTMLGRIEADEALQEQGWGEGAAAYEEYQEGEY